MSKEAKKNYVEEMKKNFTENESVMIAQYQGLNVNELDALRKELRDKGILFKITKNRITKIALKDTPKKLLMNLIPFGEFFFFKKSIAFEVIKHAFGIKTKVMIDSIPENARPRAILISRIYLFIWASIIIWSLLISSWLPVLYLLLPHYYGKGLHKLVAFTQHAGLARDVKDHRLSARDMKLNPLLSFLYWKMEYHCVHHMFPTVPAYNLEKLHYHLKDQLPEIKNGIFDTYKEIIPALKKQRDEPSYHLNISLPGQQLS